ncbi:MAG: helix-turn-helix domain-containing protein [Candidatus Eisenbacteria bacterium]|nr:helix-turn-helix domain-containing protein [Candidatus Eisenbacteria bacterium]
MQKSVDDKVLCSVPEAARRLSVSERLIWRAISEGILEVVRLGRATRVRVEEVERVAREGLATGGSK